MDFDGFTGGGQAAISELGRALDRVRAAGKPVLARGVGYDDASYLLAAHASEVWLDPMGAVLTPGPGGTRLYYKGLLDKLGVEAHVYRVGRFKSAVEPFVRTEASPEAREAEQALIGTLWDRWQEEVAVARPRARFAAYIGGLVAGRIPNGTLAEAARDAGLVDRIGDKLAFGKRVAAIVGADAKGGPGAFHALALDRYIDAHPAPTSGDAIGVVTVAGDIVDGKAPAGTAGGDTIAEALARSLARDDLKALVVRIDSPGGSALASDRIRSAILAAKAKGLPVVVSMGSVAASGGYWVSTAGDVVFAEPSTITGSIGVFGIIPTFRATLAKAGLSADGVRATPLSGQPDPLIGTTPQVDALIQAGVSQTYARFLLLVAQARHLPLLRVDAIGQGRVWDGGRAHALGLVDRFGGLSDAIAEAARRAKLDPAKVHPVYVERPSSFRLRLLKLLANPDDGGGAASADAYARLHATPEAAIASALGDVHRIVAGPAIQARCLACGAAEQPPPADLAAARRLLSAGGL
jgi:protease-4